MHWVRGRQVVLLLVVAMVLVACGNGDNGDEEDPPPIGGEDVDEPGTSDDSDDPEASEEDDDDPYAVPDEVDEDYAERVINALFELRADANQRLFEYERAESLREDEIRLLQDIYEGEAYTAAVITLQDIADEPEQAEENYVPVDDLGPAVFESEELLHVEDGCMVVAGYYDLEQVQRDVPFERGEDFTVISLSPIEEQTSDSLNPTPWRIRDQLAMETPEGDPIPPAEWDEVDFGDSLDRTCEER